MNNTDQPSWRAYITRRQIMKQSIQHPELLEIYDDEINNMSFGGNQSWYQKSWPRKSGCGPTAAANILAYIAHTREGMANLYKPDTLGKSDFLKHMECLFQFVTPGLMGVNHIDKFVKGISRYGSSQGHNLNIKVLTIEEIRGAEDGKGLVAEFVRNGLEADCPIAFLNLSRGHELRLQDWHWITITSAVFDERHLMVTASDEGERRTFDLQLWFQTTKMHGGLVYIG